MAERPYHFVAVVRRVVMDNIRLTVRAENPIVGRDKAEKFLSVFPEPSDVEGVDYGYIENRENLDTEVLDLGLDRGNRD